MFRDFPPGSVLAFTVSLPPAAESAVKELQVSLADTSLLSDALAMCGLVDLNVLLYRHAVEERVTIGTGAYEIPSYGTLVYCGLQVLSYPSNP